ncbi:BTB/POZ domain-containing protein 3-like protein [Aphelenchoides avenae]|nr:BTB/POZ domain-containing protein 3-like protein [Aphelenchus avenae]
MFFGSVPQENPVVVKDSNPAAFEAFLRFGDDLITEAQLFPLLYLGKKYIVRSLVKVVLNYLERCISSYNVGQIMLNGQNFLEDSPPKFWKSVESHGEALLKSEDFLQLHKNTVQALLQRELEVEEKFIYDKAVAWAKAECARNQQPDEGETLRNALKGILHLVRVPTMTAEEFAEGPAGDAILTAEEKVQVLRWFAGAIPQSTFPDTPRTGSWNVNGTTQAIDFSVSRAISVTGLGTCEFYIVGHQSALVAHHLRSEANHSYSIVAKLALGATALATKSLTGTVRQSSATISISFHKPIKIDAKKRYTASVVVTGPNVYYGYNGTSSKTVGTKKGDVVFNFMQSDVSSSTTLAQGMLLLIAFRT